MSHITMEADNNRDELEAERLEYDGEEQDQEQEQEEEQTDELVTADCTLDIKFKRYGRIENVTKSAVVQQSRSMEWIMTEKVHGANFSFITDGQEVQCASRSNLLTPFSKFFNFQVVLQNHRQRVLDCFAAVQSVIPETKIITIFGEIFGGKYPHPEVPACKVEGVKVVQHGVYYAPHNDFYAFDLNVNYSRFLPFDEATRIFKACGFLHAQPLARGSLQSLSQFDVETFETTIPSLLGLPAIAKNLAEGVVLRPATCRSGIVKLKRAAFCERMKHPIDGLAKKDRQSKHNEDVQVPAELDHLISIAMEYVNTNRLRSVLSKIGQVGPQEMARVAGLLSQDAILDCKRDHEADMARTIGDSSTFRRVFNGAVLRACRRLVLEAQEAIVSGEL
eukprot:GILK01006188.1.p1 GENE.GILK01006188.1~~GILK01006188.1.p1  ORF type:complete len:392 (+),score=64.89 GILK01006188.1:60-1235(+)